MSDFGAFVEDGGDIKLAASSEFVNSAAALPAFQKAYGFELSPDQLVILSGGDTAATIAAAARQTSGVNAAMVYGTDGGIAPSGLVVMEDDKHVQPVYQPAPIVRGRCSRSIPKSANCSRRYSPNWTSRRCRSSTAGSRSAASRPRRWRRTS